MMCIIQQAEQQPTTYTVGYTSSKLVVEHVAGDGFWLRRLRRRHAI